MIIYDKTGEVLFDVQVNDSSVRNRAIMGDNSVTLNLSLPEYATIPVGSYIEYQGQRYTLWRPDNFKKHGTRNFEYTITFGSNQEILKRYKYKSLSDIPFQLKFTLTAKPKMFLQLLVDNLNLRDSGWTVGDCIVATEKYLSFNHEYCYDVLGRLAQEFNTEWEIDGKTIHLRKVEKFKTEPLALSYGKGNGFRPGVGRATQGDKSPLNLLFVQGGDRNIDLATYNSRYLLLPKSKELEYEGRKYKTDKDGMYITRADKEVSQYNEDSYDASNIYPSRVGEVTAVTTEEGKDDAGNPVTFYNIVDSTIPADLNYRDCRIAGEKATMIFQTGVLTGREFDIVQTDTDLTGYDHATRTFELVPLEEDGVTLPNENLKPAIGDKYAIFNIKLPQAYIEDDATKTGASWEMFKEAVRYFYENEEEQFSFTGELDPIWAKNKWLEIGGKITPGGYIQFSDTQFQPEGILIRITSVKDYINKPHAPVIELSNVPVGGSITTDLGKIDSNEVVDENRYKGSISLTKRRFRDLEETGKMLEAAIDGFSEAINPIYIQTMSLQVGSESLQFRFVNNKTTPVETIPNFAYNQKTKVFTAPATILQHMTLGIDKISPTHKASDYKFWDMSSYTSPSLDETDAMYFYAKCSKTGTTGSFLLSKTAYKMDPGDGYYYFLVGTLSSEYEGVRSYVNVYGFTEVLPGRITTNVIASSDGQTYFNLVDGEIVAAHLTIKSGSGYNNLTDKPDLGIYATNAELSIQSDRISATVEKVNTINNTIETSGWITKGDATTIFAKKEMEGGKAIVNAINVGTDGILIQANRINLVGAVSFSMLSDYTTVNNKINGKADASSLGDLAWQDQITKGMMSVALQSELNGKVSASALGSLAYASSISKNDLASSLLTEFNGKANSTSLKALAYLDKVETAQLGSTLISGGHIVTSLIDTDSIYANQAYIGNFSIENGWLKSNSNTGENVGYIDMRSASTRVAFGTDLIPATVGGAFTCTGIISNRQTNIGGAFGSENENIALSLESKNAEANFALDCFGGIRKIGRSIDINEPYIHSESAALDVLEVKIRYYNFFNFQPASNTISIVRLPSSDIINSVFKTTMPGGTPVGLGMLEITVAVQSGFAGRIVLVGVSKGRLIQNNGDILNDYNVNGYNYGTLSLTKGNIVRLVHFNGYWTPMFISR